MRKRCVLPILVSRTSSPVTCVLPILSIAIEDALRLLEQSKQAIINVFDCNLVHIVPTPFILQGGTRFRYLELYLHPLVARELGPLVLAAGKGYKNYLYNPLLQALASFGSSRGFRPRLLFVAYGWAAADKDNWRRPNYED